MLQLGLSLNLRVPPLRNAPTGLRSLSDRSGVPLVDLSGDALAGFSCLDAGLRPFQIAARQGMRFGTVIQSQAHLDKPGPAGTGTLEDFLADNAALYVPGIAMLPQHIQPSQGDFDLSLLEAFIAKAETDGKRYRGHVLLYPAKDPVWVASTVNSGNWQALMDTHFEAVASVHGTQRFTSLDVVNELMSATQTATNGYRPNAWYLAAGGPSYIVHAFQKARALWPVTPLYWCHDHTEQITDAYHRDHVAAMLAALELALDNGAPIDGFNMQGHLTMRLGLDPVRLRNFLRDLTANLGLRVIIGELDVRTGYQTGEQEDTPMPSAYSIPDYDRVTADLAKRFLDIALPFVKTSGRELLCWGLSDIDHSWAALPSPAGERPLPYSSDYQPKPMLASIRNSLMEA